MGSLRNQGMQPLHGVLQVQLLRAVALGFDDDNALLRQALVRHGQQPLFQFIGQG